MVHNFARSYRSILRQMKLLPSFADKSSPLRKIIVDKFREKLSDIDQKHFASAASSYEVLFSSIKELKYLRGLDSGEKLDPRDKIRATAARVGLSVPQFAEEKEKELNR